MASARGREGALELYSILWSDWPTSKQKVYVTEIVLLLGVADVIFRRERSDDRKYVCPSQATAVQKGLNNYDLPHYSLFFYKSHVRRLVASCLSLLLFGVED